MFSSAFRPWNVPDLASGAYAERARPEQTRLDALASSVLERLRPAPSWKRFARIVQLTERHAEELTRMDDSSLGSSAGDVGTRLRTTGLTPSLIAESFAHIREASARHLGMKHHPV